MSFHLLQISLLDCSLAPKLYHLKVTLMAFNPELAMKLPSELWYLDAYMTRYFIELSYNKIFNNLVGTTGFDWTIEANP